jgi:signal transduction histidine kinase
MDELVEDFGAGPRSPDPRTERSRGSEHLAADQRPTVSVDRRREDRLHRLAAALAGALSTADVVAATVAHTTGAFGAAGTVVARRTADGEALELLGTRRLPVHFLDDCRNVPISAPVPLAAAARTGEPILLESRDDWGREFPEMLPAVQRANHHAAIVVPLSGQGQPGGALGIAFAEPRRFSAEERALALTVARQCSVALERARLFEAERGARARAEALAEQLAEQTRALASARAHAEIARHDAEEANAAKTAFLATMSHELRTPLNAIAGYTELLGMGIHGPVTPAQHAALARIQHSSQHLLGLINDILNFARLETGRVEFDLSPTPLRGAFDFVIEVMTQQVAGKELTLDHSSCDPGLLVRADLDKVRQILLNLFTNAVKFTAARGRITSWTEIDGDARIVRVRVRDTGIGIAPAFLARIFDPFVQLDRRHSRPAEGTGLGLAISRDLARGMGGDLKVASEVGVGSTFTLELPLVG